jgi:hypothetical protein
MSSFSVRELGPTTWPDFVRIMEKHNGVWNGCWCLQFHLRPGQHVQTASRRRAEKEELVREHRSHSALVYDGPEIVGWCQFGSPIELPGRMTAYGRMGVPLPDWRITCFFVDRNRRREGVSEAALRGALRAIAAKGGGKVDAYPIDARGKSTSGSFLWGGTASMFERAGFQRTARLGPTKWIMRRTVRPQSRAGAGTRRTPIRRAGRAVSR